MNAVVVGLLVASGRTSGSVSQRYASSANPAAGTATSALRRYAMALLGEGTLERSAEEDDQPGRRAGAHQPDAPDLPRERAEASADFDVELVEQVFADRRLVDAVGDPHGVERPQPLALLWQQREAERRERSDKRLVMAFVAGPARFEPFFFDDRKRLIKSVDERRRHSVVILPANPVVLEQGEIEVET